MKYLRLAWPHLFPCLKGLSGEKGVPGKAEIRGGQRLQDYHMYYSGSAGLSPLILISAFESLRSMIYGLSADQQKTVMVEV